MQCIDINHTPQDAPVEAEETERPVIEQLHTRPPGRYDHLQLFLASECGENIGEDNDGGFFSDTGDGEYHQINTYRLIPYVDVKDIAYRTLFMGMLGCVM